MTLSNVQTVFISIYFNLRVCIYQIHSDKYKSEQTQTQRKIHKHKILTLEDIHAKTACKHTYTSAQLEMLNYQYILRWWTVPRVGVFSPSPPSPPTPALGILDQIQTIAYHIVT